jgi:hypothetical protein
MRIESAALLPMCQLFLCMTLSDAMADPEQAAPKPAHHVHHTRHSRHVARPATPAAPSAAQNTAAPGTQPAPVPNENVEDVPPGQAPATHVTPSMLQLHYPNVGDGYIPGSSPSAMDDRNAAKAPGVEVQVPIK